MDIIGICNMALSLVGGSPIMSTADETVEAEECGRYYDIARKFCLESRDWTFAAKTRRLSPDATAISSEYAYSYALPADCLVVRVASSDAQLKAPIEFQRQENRIITDSGSLYIRYTQDIVTTARFSPAFATAVAHKLAEFISPKLTGDKALKRTLLDEADYLISEGGAVDGTQGSPKAVYASRLLRARYGSLSQIGLGKWV